MRTVTCSEFRSHASGPLDRIEEGETLIVLRMANPSQKYRPPRAEMIRRAPGKGRA